MADPGDREWRQYWQRAADGWANTLLTTRIQFAPGDVVVFLDAAGDVKQSSGHPHLHFCGIATIGWDYYEIASAWYGARQAAFSLSRGGLFHSLKDIRKLYLSRNTKKIGIFEDFLTNSKFVKLISWDSHRSLLPDRFGGTPAASVVGIVASQLEYHFGVHRRQIWFVEHSNSLSWRICANHFMSGERWRSLPSTAYLRFVEKKKVAEPGLDLADVIAFAHSQYVKNMDKAIEISPGLYFSPPKPGFLYSSLLKPALSTPRDLFGAQNKL